ncbi:DMT family transporter [Lacisediminihabitans sp. H27-G8]|uniref:DMT family transporter n=1 Tax=Lacisediminihabitans sp. H27-G8 TaxID=3111909 RepID=UPI0038FC5291
MTTEPAHSRSAVAIGVAGAVLVGVLTATQSRVNGELGRALSDGYLAAVISFGSGLVILVVALAAWAPGRRGLSKAFASVREGTTPWWYLCGGAGGALFVLSQGITGAVLGVALFTVAVVCGQTISGLAIDRNGIGHTPPAAITVTRLLGSALALVAVGVAVSAGFGGDIPAWMLLLPFAAGLAVGLQQAVNGQVRRVAGSALTATFMNFLVGATVLLVACLIHEAIVGLPERMPTTPVLYLGGLIGTIFIGGAVVVVRVTGVLLLGLGSVAGQLVMSLVLDLVVPAAGQTVVTSTVIGTLLTLVAVAIAAIPSRALRVR